MFPKIATAKSAHVNSRHPKEHGFYLVCYLADFSRLYLLSDDAEESSTYVNAYYLDVSDRTHSVSKAVRLFSDRDTARATFTLLLNARWKALCQISGVLSGRKTAPLSS